MSGTASEHRAHAVPRDSQTQYPRPPNCHSTSSRWNFLEASGAGSAACRSSGLLLGSSFLPILRPQPSLLYSPPHDSLSQLDSGGSGGGLGPFRRTGRSQQLSHRLVVRAARSPQGGRARNGRTCQTDGGGANGEHGGCGAGSLDGSASIPSLPPTCRVGCRAPVVVTAGAWTSAPAASSALTAKAWPFSAAK